MFHHTDGVAGQWDLERRTVYLSCQTNRWTLAHELAHAADDLGGNYTVMVQMLGPHDQLPGMDIVRQVQAEAVLIGGPRSYWRALYKICGPQAVYHADILSHVKALNLESSEPQRYLATILHAQRSIPVLSPALVVIPPRGAEIVQDVRCPHPGLAGQQLCMQVLLDLMVSLVGTWNVGSAAWLPVALLADPVVTRVTNDPGAVCPLPLAEQLWLRIERLHDQSEVTWLESLAEPSCN